MSNSSVKVVEVNLLPHPNAHSLSIVRIGGFTCVVNTEAFKDVKRAAYILPDSILPEELAEKYTRGTTRIRAIKLRGVVSHGLLIPMDEAAPGDDVTARLGVRHYQPPLQVSSRGEAVSGPPIVEPGKYDVENYRRYPYIQEGTQVVLTEKIHGANMRAAWVNNMLHIGSRGMWKKEDDKSAWWIAARKHKLAEKLAHIPNYLVFGEVYGQVQDLRYDHTQADPVSFAAFDIHDGVSFLTYEEMVNICDSLDIPRVPELYRGPWSEDLLSLSNGQSTLANHCREGFVVQPLGPNIYHDEIGRLKLKVVGDDYLLRK